MGAITRVYAAGGAGVNLGSQFAAGKGVVINFIDTSKANRRQGFDESSSYIIDGIDGSGKNRRENYAEITRNIERIIQKFPPLDFNIVLFAGGGGSGSVIGPLIIKELLEDKQAVIAVVVGADDSTKTVENTYNTLKSLEVISVKAGSPVVVSYHENNVGVTRSTIDQEVLFVLEALQILSSQENDELDTRDVVNYLQYHKVCSVPPQLSFITTSDNRQQAAAVVEPIAIASLYSNKNDEIPFGNAHYSTSGFPATGQMSVGNQLHFVINTQYVTDTIRQLMERKNDLDKNHNSYTRRKPTVNADDDITGDGLVL